MAQIFLSYSRDDQEPAIHLATDLKDLGHVVWLDQELTGGQAWWDQILARIRASDLFVFVLSSAALYSTACQREYGYAAELKRPILPVLVRDGLSLNVLPPALSQVQFIDFRQRHVEAIIALSRALQSLPVGLPMPDPLPAPPEVPLSYLATLSQQIETPAALSFEEQSRLVVELKRGLRDPATFQDSRDLLGRLRARRDLLATIAEEIDEVVVLQPKRQRRGSWGNTRSASASPPGERSFGIAGTSLPGQLEASGAKPGLFAQFAKWWSPADQSTLRRLAQQKIWVHWLLWVGYPPSATFLALPLVSTVVLRNIRPVVLSLGGNTTAFFPGCHAQAQCPFQSRLFLLCTFCMDYFGGWPHSLGHLSQQGQAFFPSMSVPHPPRPSNSLSISAIRSRVASTASGLRLIESMPSSTRKRANSG